jgi:hypothetical protein
VRFFPRPFYLVDGTIAAARRDRQRHNLYLLPCSRSGAIAQSPAMLIGSRGISHFGGWLLIRSASATNRLISLRSFLLRSGSFAVFSSEVIASSFRCTSAKSSLAICQKNLSNITAACNPAVYADERSWAKPLLPFTFCN